jgi:dTDP-4-amino-4,6-dideoxygalactose transaminase
MLKAEFPSWPVFAEDERAAAMRVLESGRVNYWTGEECRLFEDEFAAYVGRKHAIALANGTLALELALQAFGIGPGDEVVTTCWSFIASASCAVARGAVPVLADVDPISRNVSAETISQVLTPRTRAVICVHLVGWPCDMDPIMDLARQRGLLVIEDCAQAHGRTLQGPTGREYRPCRGILICQDKVMTTGGEGGMLLLDDDDAWKKAWLTRITEKGGTLVHSVDHSCWISLGARVLRDQLAHDRDAGCHRPGAAAQAGRLGRFPQGQCQVFSREAGNLAGSARCCTRIKLLPCLL